MTDVLAAPARGARTRQARAGAARVDHEPAFVLHSYPWRETSLIVELLTRDHGRVTVVARGAKRPTSHFRGLLVPFSSLAASWAGKGEMRNLVRLEWLGGLAPLRGEGLLRAFYLNELLVRLLARDDPHAGLFGTYVNALQQLARRDTEHGAVLRAFETDVLREVGWLPPLDQDSTGEEIRAPLWYRFDPALGFEPVRGTPDALCVSGGTLLAMARGDFGDAQVVAQARGVLRQAIRYHLNGQPLNTRRIFEDLQQL
jgi:DNA repair protein RecO (recombination protein O)